MFVAALAEPPERIEVPSANNWVKSCCVVAYKPAAEPAEPARSDHPVAATRDAVETS